MKRLKIVMLMALAFNLVTLSCSSDDDNNDVTPGGGDNTMSIDGSAFNIATGAIEEYGANGNGSFDWDVTLVSDGFTINVENQSITGTGAFLYLDLNTNSETGLVPGTYVYADERAEFTWVDAFASPNLNSETFEGTIYTAVSGTIIITGTGSSQVINVNLLDAAGKVITASYSGDLQVLNVD